MPESTCTSSTARQPPSLLHRLLDELPIGALVLDADGRVVLFNRTEQQLAGRELGSVVGQPFFEEVAPCLEVQSLAGAFRQGIGRRGLDLTLETSFPFPHLERPRDVIVNLRSFELDGQSYACILIENVSARRAIERTKGALTNLLVHDLKNPLTIITANLGLLRRKPEIAHHADLARALEDARAGAERLHRMVLDLLDITRLESDMIPVRREEASLAAIVHKVVGAAHQLASERQIELVAESRPPARLHRFDSELVRRAAENLVDNALSYAPPHTTVRVRALDEPGGCVLEVQDEGPGVPPELRASIFEPSVRLRPDSPDNRGLGLTLVRLVATTHGGEVRVEDVPAGGSLFRLRLADPVPTSP